MNKTLIVGKELCRQLLTLEDCIPAMKDTLVAASENEIKMLQRDMIHHESGNILALMPATLSTRQITGSKVVIFPGPAVKKTHTNQGIIPLFDTETGELLAITDAELLTVIRTAATSAAATDALARRDASSLAILGAGREGRMHAEAISLVRNIKEIFVWSRSPETVDSCCKYLEEKLPQAKIIPCTSPEEAVKTADIVCTTSSMKTDAPFLKGSMLKKGCHVNAVGACSPVSREIDAEVLKRSRVFLDWTPAALRDAGDLIIPINSGEIKAEDFIGEVGDVITGKLQGRLSDDDITVFESIGISAEDLAAAFLIYQKALEKGLGTFVEI